MNKSLSLGVLSLGAVVALGTLAVSNAARAMPVVSLEQGAAGLGAVTDVRHRGRPHRAYRYHRGSRIVVRPGGYAQPYGYYPAYRHDPSARGFEDPGYAYRGNLTGCSMDLGYGRFESCDQ